MLILCSLCIMSICNFRYFLFWFQGRDFGSVIIAYILFFVWSQLRAVQWLYTNSCFLILTEKEKKTSRGHD